MRPGLLLAALIGIAGVLSPNSANAEFQRADQLLYKDVLDLSDDLQPGTEYFAYAVVQSYGENMPVIYTIVYSHKGDQRVLGAFRCDKQFEIVSSKSNGLYDIRCVRQNVFSVETSVLLKADGSGIYHEHRD
ncbi:MAG: hypothetical protein JKY32_02300 [Rhizobiales bacterium]|nr:hypothetical protein [Hyphomicrobiales bacterium]